MTESAKIILNKDITAATSITADSTYDVPPGTRAMLLLANFTYTSGGTSAKAYVQSTLDGTTWFDIACFAFTTASAKKAFNLSAMTALVAAYTTTDGSMTDDTAKELLGSKLRVKYVTVGTYGASANLTVQALFK